MCNKTLIDPDQLRPDPGASLTSREGLRQHLCGEGGLGARAGGGAVLVLWMLWMLRMPVVRVLLLLLLLLGQHVPPAAVQEAVQDVGGDHVRKREWLLRPEGRLQSQRGAGQHGAHPGGI